MMERYGSYVGYCFKRKEFTVLLMLRVAFKSFEWCLHPIMQVREYDVFLIKHEIAV